MKTKHKRLIIIGCFIAWGMITMFLHTWGAIYFIDLSEPLAPLIFICTFSNFFTMKILLSLPFVQAIPYSFFDLFLFLIQFSVYAIIGTAFAFAKHPTWEKVKPESIPSEHDK